MRGWPQTRTRNIREKTDQDLGEILLRSSNVENDDENHHELLRHSGMKIRKIERTMKRIERSWRKTFD